MSGQLAVRVRRARKSFGQRTILADVDLDITAYTRPAAKAL